MIWISRESSEGSRILDAEWRAIEELQRAVDALEAGAAPLVILDSDANEAAVAERSAAVWRARCERLAQLPRACASYAAMRAWYERTGAETGKGELPEAMDAAFAATEGTDVPPRRAEPEAEAAELAALRHEVDALRAHEEQTHATMDGILGNSDNFVELTRRLRARLTIDDAMVERAARASWAHEHAQAWDELGPVRREHHMASTRAALEAALEEAKT